MNFDENIVVDGKKLGEWMKSDEGLVDYEKCGFFENVNNTEEYTIFDLGTYVYIEGAKDTRYCNGVDLGRVDRLANSIFLIPYDKVGEESYNKGVSSVNYFFLFKPELGIKDYIKSQFSLTEGDIYISQECGHVFAKGHTIRKKTEMMIADEEIEFGKDGPIKELEKMLDYDVFTHYLYDFIFKARLIIQLHKEMEAQAKKKLPYTQIQTNLCTNVYNLLQTCFKQDYPYGNFEFVEYYFTRFGFIYDCWEGQEEFLNYTADAVKLYE